MSGGIRIGVCIMAGALTVGCDGSTGPESPSLRTGGSPPRRIEIVSGDHQSAVSGTPLEADLVVRLLDERVQGVPNAPLAWQVENGRGRLDSGDTFFGTWSDADGYARARFTPEVPGEVHVTVELVGSSGVRTIFSFDAVPPDWPGAFSAARIYSRVDEPRPGVLTRYVVEDAEGGGRFSLQHLSCCFAYEFPGAFSIEGTRILLTFDEDWEGWLPFDPAERVAIGRLSGDSLSILYPPGMIRSGFVSGLYVLAR
jgi:hypothetical protein